ncbi:MAG TPA: non-ribosomal peptide synthetase, partial [Acidobacteria bacterium]|nr:non-ribosomal peptide synthetase [Acidobacteriota bacterium]
PELSGGWVLPPIVALQDRQNLVLSFAQQRLWFIDRLEGGSAHYNISGAVRVRGSLDREAFSRALGAIVQRHEALRTVFRELGGKAIQVVQAGTADLLVQEDLRGLAEEEREREGVRRAREDARKPFDLSRDLMMRATLLTLSEREHVILLSMHHIASDGWSMGVLLRELGALYEAFRSGGESPLPPLSVQYADYAAWQRQWLRGEVLDAQMSYWRSRLEGLPVVHGLPLDAPRPAREGFEGGQHVAASGTDLTERIAALCRKRGVTPFMVLQAAFAILLGRTSQETDVVMGSPIAGRVHRDLEPLIGFFVNTLVLRTDLSGDPRVEDFLAAGKQTILDAYAHQHLPFEMLVEELRPERSLSHSPLFQILFVLQNRAVGGTGLGGSRLEAVGEGSGIVKLDLELNALEHEEGLILTWLYKTDLFEAATVERMAVRFGVLLEGLLAHPEARVQDLPLLGESDRSQLSAWNATAAAYPVAPCLHGLIAAQAGRTPEATAVEAEGLSLSFGEL